MKSQLIKSLVDIGFSEEEAKEMLIEKSDTDTDKDKDNDEWSEAEEEELEKSAKKAADMLESYKAKRPKDKQPTVIEKSLNESGSAASDPNMGDIIKGAFLEQSKDLYSKLDDIQKSLNSVTNSVAEIEDLKLQISNLSKNTPPQKSVLKAEDAILTKAIDGGVKQDDLLHLSSKIHKSQVCDEIYSLINSNKGTDIEKSLENDLMNYVAGSGVLGETTKSILLKKKNIVVS